jgi:hypothetical protein
MPFRYRLINAADGRDIGPFVSKRDDWKAGDRIGRSKGEDMVVTAVIQLDDDVGFRAYLPRRRARRDATRRVSLSQRLSA